MDTYALSRNSNKYESANMIDELIHWSFDLLYEQIKLCRFILIVVNYEIFIDVVKLIFSATGVDSSGEGNRTPQAKALLKYLNLSKDVALRGIS